MNYRRRFRPAAIFLTLLTVTALAGRAMHERRPQPSRLETGSMARHMLPSKRIFLSPVLGAALLAATALTLWLFTQSSVEASISTPPHSGAVTVVDPQVVSKADHTCTTSDDTDAGREFQLISKVTAREDLDDVYVEFELINVTRGLSVKGTAPEEHQGSIPVSQPGDGRTGDLRFRYSFRG